MTPVFDHLRDFPDMNVTADMFPASQLLFEKIGNSFPVMINDANRALALQNQYNESIHTYELQENMIIVYDSVLTVR